MLTFWWWLRDHREGGGSLLPERGAGEVGSVGGSRRGISLRWCLRKLEGGRRASDMERAYIWWWVLWGAGQLRRSC